MTCPPELSLGMHADGALEAREATELELHLVDCARCRMRVAALREEMRTLAAALAYDPASMTVPEFAPPATVGRVAAVAAVILLGAMLFTALRGLLSFSLPDAIAWLNPFDAGGIAKLAVRGGMFLFFDRGGAIVASILDTAVAGVLLILLVWGVAALRGRIRGPFVMVSVLCAIALQPTPSHAVELRHNENGAVLVSADETVNDTLIAVGDTVEVNGNVAGDLIAFGRRVVIRGNVAGLVFTGAQSVTLDGAVEGSVIAGAETLDISSSRIGRNLFVGGETVTVNGSAGIEQNVLVGGSKVSIAGRVGRDVLVGAEELEVAATIGNTLTAYTKRVTLLAPARITGDVRAHGLEEKDHVVVSPGAVIGGELITELQKLPHEESRYLTGRFYGWQLLWFAAAFIVGFALLAMVPALRRIPFDEVADVLRSSAFGMVALVATPVIALLACVTVIGIPLGVIALLAWGIGIYLAKVLVAQVVGTFVVETVAERREHFAVALAVGLFIVTLATNLPFVGGLVSFLVTIVGLGLFVLFLRAEMQEPSEYD